MEALLDKYNLSINIITSDGDSAWLVHIMKVSRTKKTCIRDHVYYKSSDCPVCPVCWSGYYREKNNSDLPDKLSAPALRALLSARIYNLKQLSHFSEKEILKLHGIGPSSLPTLRKALQDKGLTFGEM